MTAAAVPVRDKPTRRRRTVNAVMLVLLSVAAILATLPLILIIYHLL